MTALLSPYATLLILLLFHTFNLSSCDSFIGVNYGTVADNLPQPSATAKLLQTTAIEKVRLYGADPAIIKALAHTDIGIVIGTANSDIPNLASDVGAAKTWLDTNVIPFYPSSKIILITVGNEVLTFGDQNLQTQLLPAMQNLQNALNSASLGAKIKVSTVHAMAVLGQSEPPSSGAFKPELATNLKGILEFNDANNSPFAINPYPYFAYTSDPRPDTLAFCLFQPNAGRVDANTKIKYMNMFDAQVDSVRSALNSMGFKNVEIVVAETGWPYKGDTNEVGASIDNAKAYNGNLISHLRSMSGTPLMPGKPVDTYLFALYDEDLKPGTTSERSFGLFKPDLSVTYDIGLLGQNKTRSVSAESPSEAPAAVVAPVAAPGPKKGGGVWCVPKQGLNDTLLQGNLNYACGHGVDCGPIQAGGPCFQPDTLEAHAAYAMNLYYQIAGRDPKNCDFANTATLTSTAPSYNNCFLNTVSNVNGTANLNNNNTRVDNSSHVSMSGVGPIRHLIDTCKWLFFIGLVYL